MAYFVAVDIDGNPQYSLSYSIVAPQDNPEAGIFFKEVTAEITPADLLSGYYWSDGWIYRGARPAYGLWAKVDDLWQWVIDVEACRTLKLENINRAYDEANLATFEYEELEFNADVVAQNNLNATAHYIGMFDEFPPNWLGVWLAADGTTIPMIELIDFKNLYRAFVAKGVANIARFELLKAQILSAATVAELDAITW